MQDAEHLLMALNLGDSLAQVENPVLAGRILLTTSGDRTGEAVAQAIALRPNEGVIVALTR